MGELKTESEKTSCVDGIDIPATGREIKDGVCKLLFEIPENAAELYPTLKSIECGPDEIQIITITTTISGKLKNDLTFVVFYNGTAAKPEKETLNLSY